MRVSLLIGGMACLLLAGAGLAQEPAEETLADGIADASSPEFFYLKVEAAAGDSLLFSSVLTYINSADGICTCISGSHPEPVDGGEFVVTDLVVARPPAGDDANVAPAIEGHLDGAPCPPLSEAVFGGHRILYYFMDAELVSFTLIRLADPESFFDEQEELEGDPEGELVGKLTVAN